MFILVSNIKAEMGKMIGQVVAVNGSIQMKTLSGHPGVMQSNENRISFLLNLIEPLIVNDMNNDIGISTGILETLV